MTASPATTAPATLATTAARTHRGRAPRIPMLLRQLRAELRSDVRSPEFVVPVLALPVVLYLVFGAPAPPTRSPAARWPVA